MDTNILEVRELCQKFSTEKGEFTAVDHVSFTIGKGECVGLIGESGSGKSTVANGIAGLLKPSRGEIFFKGRDLLTGSSRQQIENRKEMQMVFQDPMKSFSPQMRLLTGVAEGLRYHTGLSRSEREVAAKEMLESMGLPGSYASKKCRQLSGGECQRAALARAMLIHPELLICDEVTSALDVSVQAQIIRLLYDVRKKEKMSCLFISHDLALVSGFCDRILVMYQGKIVESGPAREIICQPRHEYTKKLISSVYLV